MSVATSVVTNLSGVNRLTSAQLKSIRSTSVPEDRGAVGPFALRQPAYIRFAGLNLANFDLSHSHPGRLDFRGRGPWNPSRSAGPVWRAREEPSGAPAVALVSAFEEGELRPEHSYLD